MTDSRSSYSRDIFKRLFITDNQPPFSAGIRSSVRVKQAEKRHFSDPSLACALLKATPAGLLGDLETLGFLFEALCERDLRIYAESFGASLYHYQDYKNQEIDAVIELPDGRWCAFEIKLGANQIDSAAANLLEIKEQLSEDPKGKPPGLRYTMWKTAEQPRITCIRRYLDKTNGGIDLGPSRKWRDPIPSPLP